MSNIRHFKDIIEMWPTAADFGRDLDIGEVSARAMKRRNAIPSQYWGTVVVRASERGLKNITLEILAKLAEKKIKPKNNTESN